MTARLDKFALEVLRDDLRSATKGGKDLDLDPVRVELLLEALAKVIVEDDQKPIYTVARSALRALQAEAA